MFLAITRAARHFDLWLGKSLGRPYHALLAIGIVIEIVQHCREIGEKTFAEIGIIKAILAIALFLALLVHQCGELSEHAERQREHHVDAD
jgi:hypothetical protein